MVFFIDHWLAILVVANTALLISSRLRATELPIGWNTWAAASKSQTERSAAAG
jgi:hypothetical protein